MTTIDARLVKLYNEYLKNDKEEEFLRMLYALLDMATPAIKAKVARSHRYYKMKLTREERKTLRQKLEAYLNAMTPEQRIEFLNTPWEKLPEWIKEGFPEMVKFPGQFNFLRIAGEVAREERQHETFGARLVRYMEAHGFVTSSEKGTKLHFDHFSEVCNELAEIFDIPATKTRKGQRTRVTVRDLQNYTSCNVTPKIDKLTTIAVAMDCPMTYLGGYGPNEPPKNGPTFGPYGSNGGGSKFKKSRKNKTA